MRHCATPKSAIMVVIGPAAVAPSSRFLSLKAREQRLRGEAELSMTPTITTTMTPGGAALPTFRRSRSGCGSRSAASTFGGPAGQIAMMHRMVVDEKKWMDEPRFLHALTFCMLLPGPEAQKLATYIGWAAARREGRPRGRHPVRAAGRAVHAGA